MIKLLSNNQRTLGLGISNHTEGSDVLTITGNTNISGIVCFNRLKVLGTVTYYGDGSNLTGITASQVGAIADIVTDTTPQLGGDLDVNSNDITGTGNVNLTGVITATSFSGNVTGNATGLSGSPSITVTDITSTGNVSIAGTLTYEDVTNVDSVGLITARSGVRVTVGGIEVSNGGLNVTGVSTFQGNVKLGDNDKLRLGDDNELTIFHNGTNSYVANTVTGNLIIQNGADDKDIILNCDNGSGGNVAYLRADGSTGEAILYHYGSEKLSTKSNGIDVTGHTETDTLNVSGISTFTGNIVVSGTVDGRDVATDGTKLDGIESGADVTDATNVAAAGAVMESDTSTASMSFVVDEDDMSSNSSTKIPTQQSVKAYVDANGDVVSDTTPQLGGDLDVNNNDITGTGNINLTGVVTATSFSGDGSNITGIAVTNLQFNDSSISIATTDGSILLKSNSVIVASISTEAAYWKVPLHLDNNKITNLAAPSSLADAANKDYVDNRVAGDFPTGDYGDLGGGDTDAFGQVITNFTAFDCLVTPSGSLSTTDLGELT